MRESERSWSPSAFLLLFGGGAVFMAAFGLINSKWGWVILAVGTALIGLTYISNIKTLHGSVGCLFEQDTYASWSTVSKALNRLGNVLVVVGVILIWAQ